ncbi:MAG TPA: excinuclease ABC subunit UvrC [Dongiaceae bacterium]|jgi:excinuclease ABC subunit C
MSDDTAENGQIPDIEPAPRGVLARGVEVIADALRRLPQSPGVYRMLNKSGDALYVGKARNLKKRVNAYTQIGKLPERLRRMVAETTQLEVVTTNTEVEALLLEINLIKRLMPRYNVLLRDDKSFPYILITGDHAAPQIAKHRGSRARKGDYYGPFASAGAVHRTITALQRAFLLRSCNDSVFGSRTRPCLLYQIKRCSGPCVGRISLEDYGQLVQQAKAFLSGESREVQSRLAGDMQAASDALDFERAGAIRDRLRALAHVQAHQDINVSEIRDADVIAGHQAGGHTCVQVFFFRAGSNFGNRAYFPSHDRHLPLAQVLAGFIALFYANKPPPPLILVNELPAECALLAEALGVKAERKVEISKPIRGARKHLVDNALSNAREALARRLAENASQRHLLEGVQTALGLEQVPQRIEVYDNSHLQGRNAYGAMIVAGPDGFMKNAYRKFSIAGDIAPGDDYAMMREVMSRRFARAQKEDPERERGQWPDLVMIDGGAGQLAATESALADLGIDDVALVAIAKGPDRDAGRERFFRPGQEPFSLELRDPVLYYLQRLRDEAHRFAIGTHRAKRSADIARSPLDEIPGIGGKRKRALLMHFGSARGVAAAGLSDLETVEGISKAVAKKVYDHFHAQS